jgi:hypothetical protein
MWYKYLITNDPNSTWKQLFKQSIQIPQQPINFTNLNRQAKDLNLNWLEITTKDIYKQLQTKTHKKYEIENIMSRTYNLDNIWQNWSKLNICNKIKIETHRVITDKIIDQKVKNRSGNCPTCDFDIHYSRDHIFLNCRGIQKFKTNVEREWGIQLDTSIFYNQYKTNKEATLKYIYIYNILICRLAHRNRWGTITVPHLQASFKNLINIHIHTHHPTAATDAV